MSYQVIARKYRPQTFEEVVGQGPIVQTLRNAIEQKRIHHAYLFSGPRGVGKTTVARLLAKSLNCAQGPTVKPCNACASCAEITQSRSMDVLEIDGASNRGIENIRELRETVRYTPARDRSKVFIIDEVHMLTDPAWNALLKTLEEPPPHVVFVFATTDYRALPVTILSRCQHFEFKKMAGADLLAHLRLVAEGEGVTAEPRALDLIVRVADGSLRDALSALDQVIAFSGSHLTDETARTILGVIDSELIVDFFAAVREADCGRLVAIIDTVLEKGHAPVEFLEDLMAYGRDLLLARTVPDAARYLPGTPEEKDAIVKRASAFSEDELLRLLEMLTREEARVRHSAHPRFLLEALGIKLARLAELRPIEELLARLDEDGGGPPPGRPAGTRPSQAAPVPPPRPIPAKTEATERPSGPPQAIVEAILRRVHEERAAVGALLEQAVWVQVLEDSLRVVYNDKQTFLRDKVRSRDVTDYLRGVARDLAGRDLRIQVDTASPATFEAAAVGAAPAPGAAAATVPLKIVSDRAPEPALPARSRGAAPLDEPARRALLDRAMQEPAVRSLLDTLGGELVDIEPA